MKKQQNPKQENFIRKKGVVLGKYIVISDTAGTLTMIDTTNDKVTDTKDIGEAFSGNITYDEMTGTIYFVAGTNDLYGIKVSADGKLKDEKKSDYMKQDIPQLHQKYIMEKFMYLDQKEKHFKIKDIWQLQM